MLKTVRMMMMSVIKTVRMMMMSVIKTVRIVYISCGWLRILIKKHSAIRFSSSARLVSVLYLSC